MNDGEMTEKNECFIFHKWSKWEQYEHHYNFHPGLLYPKEVQGRAYHNVDIRQRRICDRCGTMQDKLVAENVSLNK